MTPTPTDETPGGGQRRTRRLRPLPTDRNTPAWRDAIAHAMVRRLRLRGHPTDAIAGPGGEGVAAIETRAARRVCEAALARGLEDRGEDAGATYPLAAGLLELVRPPRGRLDSDRRQTLTPGG